MKQNYQSSSTVANKDLGQYYNMVEFNQFSEKVSGYPKPELYDHYYINKYSYPRGLATYKKPEEGLDVLPQ